MKSIALACLIALVAAPAAAGHRHRHHGLPTYRQIVATPSLAQTIAHRNGVPARLLHGVIMVESGYNCHARNGRASGIGQVFPATARSVGVHGNLFDCATGLEAAARYLKLAINKGGAGCAGVSLYERGVGSPARCTAYGRKVMAYAR